MNLLGDALYPGVVTHTRLRPVRHDLRYHVFSVLFDVDRLDEAAKRLRLFSRNRFNLFSLFDKDHGDGQTLLPFYLRGVAEETGLGDEVERFQMLCYPRILGYAFNPLTVYYGLDAENRIRLVIYEVRNTFHQRRTYVIPAEQSEVGQIVQSAAKELYVSPFNPVSGGYTFRLSPIADTLTVGIALADEEGPLLNARFTGQRQELTDGNLLRALGRTGWMTVKVVAGIHFEALKLWLKGMRFAPRPPAPDRAHSFIPQSSGEGMS